MSDDEQKDELVELEIPETTAPTFPWEVVLRNSYTFFQRRLDGGMELKFCPLATMPAGLVPIPPGFVIEFNADAWERFKREVAADGVKPPAIETVRTFPGGLLNGSEPA